MSDAPSKNPPAEAWRKAKHSMPDVMRLIWTSNEALLRSFSPDGGDRWPEHPVFAVIGPFDNHTGQTELQERIKAVVRQWNAECAERELSPTP